MSTQLDLPQAIKNNELILYYQPIVCSQSTRIKYFEALVRWNHPIRGLISPLEFIPHAEKTGDIVEMGEWVIKSVCEQLNNWRKMNLCLIPIAINISGLQFQQQVMSVVIKKYLDIYHIEAKYIELEFTESILIEHTESIKQDIMNLKNLNIKLTIDDFGTYYSNLAYLKHFTVDKIKIDKMFIRDLHLNEIDRSLVLAIINMAHSLKLKVVAEGVENAEQVKYLREQKVDELQGFYFSKPINADSCIQFLD